MNRRAGSELAIGAVTSVRSHVLHKQSAMQSAATPNMMALPEPSMNVTLPQYARRDTTQPMDPGDTVPG